MAPRRYRRPPPRGCFRHGYALQGPARRGAGREASWNHAFLGSERETSAWCATRWDERGSRARTSAANEVTLQVSRRASNHRGHWHGCPGDWYQQEKEQDAAPAQNADVRAQLDKYDQGYGTCLTGRGQSVK